MADSETPIERVPDFELPNVAAGADPFSLAAVAGDPDTDAVVLLFQRDYGESRRKPRASARG